MLRHIERIRLGFSRARIISPAEREIPKSRRNACGPEGQRVKYARPHDTAVLNVNVACKEEKKKAVHRVVHRGETGSDRPTDDACKFVPLTRQHLAIGSEAERLPGNSTKPRISVKPSVRPGGRARCTGYTRSP